jgi:hypothetical protein
MNLQELEKEAREELAIEKKDIAKDILKSRIVEIEKAEKMLAKLKGQYQVILNKSIEEVVDEVENGNIRY